MLIKFYFKKMREFKKRKNKGLFELLDQVAETLDVK